VNNILLIGNANFFKSIYFDKKGQSFLWRKNALWGNKNIGLKHNFLHHFFQNIHLIGINLIQPNL